MEALCLPHHHQQQHGVDTLHQQQPTQPVPPAATEALIPVSLLARNSRAKLPYGNVEVGQGKVFPVLLVVPNGKQAKEVSCRQAGSLCGRLIDG